MGEDSQQMDSLRLAAAAPAILAPPHCPKQSHNLRMGSVRSVSTVLLSLHLVRMDCHSAILLQIGELHMVQGQCPVTLGLRKRGQGRIEVLWRASETDQDMRQPQRHLHHGGEGSKALVASERRRLPRGSTRGGDENTISNQVNNWHNWLYLWINPSTFLVQQVVRRPKLLPLVCIIPTLTQRRMHAFHALC